MTPREALDKAIRVLGSQTALAAAAGEGIKTGHVYHWLKEDSRGVPAAYCPGIERATREKGVPVLCEELCPGPDWAAIRGQAGNRRASKAAAA